MEEWRMQDPIEDRLLRETKPSEQLAEMDVVLEKIEETKQELNSDAVEVTTKFMELVAETEKANRKAKRIEQTLENEL